MASFRLFLVAALVFLPLDAARAQTNGAAPLTPRPALPAMAFAAESSGVLALAAIGDRLPAVAAHYRRDPEELRAMLLREKDLRLDRQGRLFYQCAWGHEHDLAAEGSLPFDPKDPANPPVATAAETPAAIPLADTFLLHSRPGATKKIFLDFDGHLLSGTAWNDTRNGGGAIAAPAWSLDGNAADFNDSERLVIQRVWQRMAEDFAPYDVDVTTEFPGEAALTRSGGGDQAYGMRVLISPISSYFGSIGGIAYVGVFDNTGDYYKPAIVLPDKLGNSEKNIAEAASHEVGHTLGLSHDGGTGVEYYGGHGNWAPIMGVGYGRAITQWSKGEYSGANNTEDDLTVITTNGLAYRSDAQGNTLAAATALTGTSIATSGVIERTADIDFFSFTSGSGNVEFLVAPAERGANLRLRVTVYNAAGVVLATRETADTSAGTLAVSFTQTVASGVTYVAVEGVGSGSDYSDYGSLGAYTLGLELPTDSTWAATAAGAYSWSDAVNWTNGSPNVIGGTARLTNNIVGDQTLTVSSPVTLARLRIGDTDSGNAFTVLPTPAGVFNLVPAFGPVEISKTSGANDLVSVPFTLSAPLEITNFASGSLTLGGHISGAQPVTKLGAGTLIFGAGNGYTGDTTVFAGTLAVGASGGLASSPRITLAAGSTLDVSARPDFALSSAQTLEGSGSVTGSVTLPGGSTLVPGGAGAAGTLSASGDLSLQDGAVLRFDLGSAATPGAGVNDLVAVGGSLAFSGQVALDVNLADGGLAGDSAYRLFNYGGVLSGSAANLAPPAAVGRVSFAVDTATPGQVDLQVIGAPAALVWRGGAAAEQWQTGAGNLNWLAGGAPEQFLPLDTVLFDDTAASSAPVQLVGELRPGLVVVDGTLDRTLAGAGSIAGNTRLRKSGSGTLVLASPNTYAGLTTVSAGTLRVGHPSALGSTAGATVVAAGATLDLAGASLGAEPVVTSGVIANSGPAQTSALRAVTLSGPATFSADARWDLRAGTLAGAGFALTKTGAEEVRLAGLGATGLGAVAVNAGTLVLEGDTDLGSSSTVTVASGARLGLYQLGDYIPAKPVSVQSGGVLVNLGGDNVIGGSLALSSGSAVEVAADSLELRVAISGSALAKTGPGTLVLTRANTYSGDTSIAAGALQVGDGGSSGSLSSLSAVLVSAGARLRLARSDNFSFANSIRGDGLLEKAGSNTVTLATVKSHKGGTLVSGGVLAVSAAGALGTGPLTVETVTDTGRVTIASGLTIANPVVIATGSPGVGNGVIGVVNSTSSATFTGPVTVRANTSSGGHFLGPTSSGLLAFLGPITLEGAATTLGVRNGFVRFSGGGSYPGLTLNEGTLTLGAVNGVATNASLLLAPSGTATFNLSGFNQTLAGLAKGANAATVTNSGSHATLTLNGGPAAASSYAGTLSGNLRLAVASGRFAPATLGHTGGTLVSGGTLALPATANTLPAAGAVTVSGGILDLGGVAHAVSGVFTTQGGLVRGGTVTKSGAAYDLRGGEVSAVLGGAVGLVKSGADTATLSGLNTYSGETNIQAGSLRLAHQPVFPLLRFSYETSVGSTVVNEGSNGIHGTLTGSAVIAPGEGIRGGAALRLDGAAGAVVVPSAVTALDGNTSGVSWTYALWLRTDPADTTPTGSAFGYQGDGGWVSGNTTFYLNQGNTTPGARVGGVRWGGGWLTGAAAVNDHVWHHVAIVVENGAKRIYVDGVLDASFTVAQSWQTVGTGAQFWVGGTPNLGDGTAPFHGWIDDTYVFNRALTQPQVQALRDASFAAAPGTVSGGIPSSTLVSVASGATLETPGFLMDGDTLRGAGTVKGPVTARSSTLSPGLGGPGRLTFTDTLTLVSTTYAWEVADWTGGPGLGHDTLSVNALALDTQPLAVILSSPALVNFSAGGGRVFTLVSSAAPIPETLATLATINASAFTGASGDWTIRRSAAGTELLLIYTPGPATPLALWAALQGLDATNSDPAADPDGDGLSNLAEFAFGGSALDAGSRPAPVAEALTDDDGQSHLALTLPLRVGATFTGAGEQVSAVLDGLVYRVQCSADLVDFISRPVVEVPGPEAVALQAGLPPAPAGYAHRSFRSATPRGPDNPREFLRVKVDIAP